MNKKPICDHNGNVFATITDMCKHYGVSRNAYNHRIARGASLEEALTKPVAERIKRNLKTPEEVREYNHARRIKYYYEHRDEARDYNKKYYQQNREHYLEYHAQYRAAHNDYWRGYRAAQKKYEMEEIRHEH